MNDSFTAALDRLKAMEADLGRMLEEQRKTFHYTIDKGRVRFEAAARERHKRFRSSILRTLARAGPRRLAAGIVIYLQIVPLVLLDLAVTLFQHVSVPIFGIARVSRRDFIAIDRHRLAYLNAIEKINCVYCGYANGLLAYAREIAGRTEEHFCPIKHARVMQGLHRRYHDFADYGDAEGFRNKSATVDAKAAARLGEG